MRILPLVGGSMLALASTALAQQPERPTPARPADQKDEPAPPSLDTLVPADNQTEEAVPKPTGDAILDRLNALEARVKQLEARNAELEQQAELNQGRIETVENRAAKAAQFGWAPTVSDANGNFTFKPRGVIEADAVAFHERKGGYDYNDGTGLRRARLDRKSVV